MSARSIRRTFAAPVVITLATSCAPAPEQIRHNPPSPGAKEPAPTTAVDYDQRWTIRHDTVSAKCTAMAAMSCPENASCNPPPPSAYKCPDGFTEGQLTVVLRANTTDCFIEHEMSCPEGAKCNPPPPQKVPCPK